MKYLAQRVFSIGLTLTLLSMSLPPSTAVQANSPPTGYRKLQPVPVFQDTLPGTWACDVNIDNCDLYAPNNLPPVDNSPSGMYNGLPSLKLDIRPAESWWWMVILAGPGWTTRSIANYVENGFLEFNVKSATGGEQFVVTLTDVVPGRTQVEHHRSVTTTAYVTITNQWQHVQIPLKDFKFEDDLDFNPVQVRDVRFSQAPGAYMTTTLWINDIKFTSPDDEPAYPAIKVNQLGYPEAGEKYALLSGFVEDLPASLTAGAPFNLVRTNDNAVVYTGTLQLVSAYEPYVSGERIFRADFSQFTTPGIYYLAVPISGTLLGGSNSPTFTIASNVYNPLVVDAARYFYYQRQGITLTNAFAGDFARGLGHPQDAQAPLRSALMGGGPITTTYDVSQGWYDAGDYGKYVAYAAPAVDTLLSAYELYTDLFTATQFNIPESNNTLPDLLDEIKWELDWVLKMQDSDGGFYERVYPNNAPATPDADAQTRYIEDLLDGSTPNTKPTRATAVAAAYLAHAARVYQPFDATYAQQLLQAAEDAWDYLEAHPNCYPTTWWTCTNSTWNTEAQNRLWAAAELFHTTGDQVYNSYFLQHYTNTLFSNMWLTTTENAGDVGMRAFLAYNTSPNANSDAKAWFIQHFNIWREHQLARSETTPWRNFLHDGSDGSDSDYYWGSNSVTLETIVILARGSKIAGNYDWRVIRAAYAQLNYILGINPLRLSYVAGYGADSIQTLYSHIYSHDGKPGIPAGYMVEGPNQYDGGLAYSRFYGKTYAPTNSDWTTSEHAIYYNAHLVFVAALAAAEQGFTPIRTVYLPLVLRNF